MFADRPAGMSIEVMPIEITGGLQVGLGKVRLDRAQKKDSSISHGDATKIPGDCYLSTSQMPAWAAQGFGAAIADAPPLRPATRCGILRVPGFRWGD